MIKTKLRTLLALIVAVPVITLALITSRDEGAHSVTPPEGGTWEYGASGGITWSNFKNDQPHSASVQGHTFVDSGCVENGWARVQAPTKWITVFKNEQYIAMC
ncbi:MAG: lactococcin 972 family bacteriocin [Corynebacterium sp.]|nr:lactococcin 972 family bacteriocin [Corynebacterium sp.]